MSNLIYVTTSNTPSYTCEVDIFGTLALMQVTYNKLTGKRLVKILSRSEELLFLRDTYIDIGSRVYLNNNFTLMNDKCYLILTSVDGKDATEVGVTDYLNWKDKFRLCFVQYETFEQ